ncbi:DUF2274 domain-containing protein [Sphingopyxis sp. 550A]
MAGIKLGKLPDRTPVKIAVTVTPELDHALRDYLELYRAAYGDTASTVADLIPAMLEAFLVSDRTFAKTRRNAVTSP